MPNDEKLEAETTELTAHDLKTVDLESRFMKLKNPIFLVAVPTPKMDHFGVLTLQDDYLHFKPVNPAHCGEFDYEAENEGLAKTNIIEFKVNYNDFSDEEPVVMPMPSMEEDKLDDFPINFSAQLTLFRTGYYSHANESQKKQIDSYRSENLGIATITLKIPNFKVSKVKRNNEEREAIANILFSELMRRKGNLNSKLERKKKTDTFGENTTISVFDIVFETLAPELEEQEGSKLGNADKRLELFKSVYGFKNITSIKEIENMSLFPLNFTFPELEAKVSFEEISNRRGGFVADFTTYDFASEVLQDPSRIISIESAMQIKDKVPSYLCTTVWKKLYSIWDDGDSYKT